MTLITNYYQTSDNQEDLTEVIRTLQQQAARVEARLIRQQCETLKSGFDSEGKVLVTHVTSSLTTITEHFDLAIKGKLQKAVKQTVRETLPEYDKVFYS